MKGQFKEHYGYTDVELKKLWDEAYFVFDTNTLLNMYRYNRNTFEEYVKVLKSLSKSKKLFLPNHVGEEFFRNRIKVIQDYKKSYDEILKISSAFRGQLASKYRYHPFVDIQQLSNDIEKALGPIEKGLKNKQEAHPDWIQEDNILEQLTDIFSGCTGDPFTEQEKEKIFSEGEVRYKKKIPPGFKDSDKEGERQYGDLLVWKQMLDFAKKNKKPIVFITGDEKEDWWLLNEGKRLMPLPSLKREMRTEAGVDFHAYTADRFLETYNDRNASKGIDTRAIEEVRKLREIQDLMEGEVVIHKDRAVLRQESDQKYELVVMAVGKLFEILEHVYDLMPSDSYEAVHQLELAEKIIRGISRKIRVSGRVNHFMLQKIASWIEKIELILRDQAMQIDDESVARKFEKYSFELQRISTLLDSGDYGV